MDPPEIERIKNRFFEIKKTYKDPAWLSPNVRNELRGCAGRARQLKSFAIASELYVFINDRKQISEMVYEIFKKEEFALGVHLIVNYVESENKDKLAKVLESGYDEWYWAAAIWHGIGDERKLFSFSIRAFLAAIKYSQVEDFNFAEEAFRESIYALSKIKPSPAFDLGENPENTLRRVISVMHQLLPDEYADAVANYIESNKDNDDYFDDYENTGI